MKQATLSRLPSRRAVRAVAMNAALMALLTGVFLWSVAGNAFDTIRSAIEKRV